ncbi:MAG: hypothetical protein ACFHWZ_04530 [Phycisphaerales bacterium]|nr:hypothetical protein [bacterium]
MTQVETPTEPRTARLSGAALGAFGMVVLAVVIGCGSLATSVFAGWNVWVGVLVAPLFALNGCILAFLALKSIERSNGRVMGRPLALVALFCGVGVTAIQGALVLLALVTLSASSTLAPVGAELVGYAQADRDRLARGLLAEDVSESMSDADLDRFAATVRDRLGTVTDSSAGFSLILDARRVFSEAGPMEGYQPDAENLPRPIYLHFGDRRVLTYVFTDQRALQDKKIRIRDMLLIADGGSVIVLAPDGPATELAGAAGWEIVRAEEGVQDLMLE